MHLTEPSETEQRKKQETRTDDSSFDLNKICNVSMFPHFMVYFVVRVWVRQTHWKLWSPQHVLCSHGWQSVVPLVPPNENKVETLFSFFFNNCGIGSSMGFKLVPTSFKCFLSFLCGTAQFCSLNVAGKSSPTCSNCPPPTTYIANQHWANTSSCLHTGPEVIPIGKQGLRMVFPLRQLITTICFLWQKGRYVSIRPISQVNYCFHSWYSLCSSCPAVLYSLHCLVLIILLLLLPYFFFFFIASSDL